ncbi:amidase [Hwanghaeella sp.]|uniref:amidase n=1 Tax=Hwanghaeella sp. TaxID=2605943 RepID=UPI003CCC20A0
MTDLISMTAVEAVDSLHKGDTKPEDFVDAAYDRISKVDGPVNAMVTLCPERARAAAKKPGLKDTLLGGLPVAVKDLNDVEGVRTTYGSPIFADHVPARSDIMVETVEARGGITIGKSNTPEFGAGANTFNEVFGKTRNPWNTALTCGGSSGGSAVALATGMTWLATGSDLGGSLRTPASFCNVVGFRPSPGTVARSSSSMPYDNLSVQGPMARTVEDVALFLDSMAGVHIEDPISRPSPAKSYLDQVRNPKAPKRVALSPNLGFLQVDPRVTEIIKGAAGTFEAMGATVEEACPDLTDTPDIFQTMRALIFVTGHALDLENHRDKLKPDVIWNIEKGMGLNADEIGKAERARAALYARVASFFGEYDLLACATAIVPPFDVDQRYVEEVNGHRFDNYIDWLAMSYAITCTSCPTISVPCGFTENGLPVGIQLVGKPRGDGELLAMAHLFQQASGISTQPIEPKG